MIHPTLGPYQRRTPKPNRRFPYTRGTIHCTDCKRVIYRSDISRRFAETPWLRDLSIFSRNLVPAIVPDEYTHAYDCVRWTRRQIPIDGVPMFQREEQLIQFIQAQFSGSYHLSPLSARAHKKLHNLARIYNLI